MFSRVMAEAELLTVGGKQQVEVCGPIVNWDLTDRSARIKWKFSVPKGSATVVAEGNTLVEKPASTWGEDEFVEINPAQTPGTEGTVRAQAKVRQSDGSVVGVTWEGDVTLVE
jgi:hypothetical protein